MAERSETHGRRLGGARFLGLVCVAVALGWPLAIRADGPMRDDPCAGDAPVTAPVAAPVAAAVATPDAPDVQATPEATGPDTAPLASPAAVVQITDLLQFEPGSVQIHVGDVVEWKNVSVLVHTATGDPALAQIEGSAVLPEGAAPFDSGNLEPQATFRHRFDVPGTYQYFCIPHEAAKMTGTVVVLGPGTASSSTHARRND